MKEKTYRKVLYFILLAGTIVSIAHGAYAVYLYQTCSILALIANGG